MSTQSAQGSTPHSQERRRGLLARSGGGSRGGTSGADGQPGGSVKHPVDEVLRADRLGLYGLQHVLAFYAGAVVVPILLATSIGLNDEQLIYLINADLFTCGIATIIQSVGFWKIGVRLPLIQGATFTAVSPMIAIGNASGGGVPGLKTIYGAVIIGGIFSFVIAPFFAKIIRFFPPIVTGTVITSIGLVLLPVAAQEAGGGNPTDKDFGSLPNLAMAGGTLLIIILIYRFSRGFFSTVAVLLGLVLGTAGAALFGKTDFDGVSTAAVLGVTSPFHYGAPTFKIAAILSMIVVMLITAVETTGDVFATGEIVNKPTGSEDVDRAIRADGLATTIGGVLNAFPYTCFAENVGLVRLTRVRSRWVVATAGVIMIVLGVLPKAGALVAAIPSAVLGGAAIAMFGTVAVIGLQTLTKVDLHDERNVVILAASLGLGLIPVAYPTFYRNFPQDGQVVLGSGITMASLTAIVLNIVFHVWLRRPSEAEQAAVGAGRRQPLTLEQVNTMSRHDFVATFSRVFPGPDWIADRACNERPFESAYDLRHAFHRALFEAPHEVQLELIRRYPDLAGDAVSAGTAPAASSADQAAAGLDRLPGAERDAFAAANAAYRQKFGFPAIVRLRGRTTEDILAAITERLDNTPEQEVAAALLEIAQVANLRLGDLVAGEVGDVAARSSVGTQP